MNHDAVRRVGHLQAALGSDDGTPVDITIDVGGRWRPWRILCDYLLQPAAWFLVWAVLSKVTGISL